LGAVAAALVATLVLDPAALAQGAKTSSVTDADISRLKPGEFIWAPNLAPQGPMLMVVSLKAQQAYVYRNGIRIGASTVSSGKDGKDTPTGVFTILQKKEKHRSNLYNNAPMPYMQRLTWDGIALHAGNLPGYPASHGCVRLPYAFAQKLFAQTSLGMTVVINNEAANPRRLDSGDLLVPVTSSGAPAGVGPTGQLGPNEPYQWTPAVAPTGPVTIVLGVQEQRMVVLRNGKIIGKSRVRIAPGRVTGVHALELAGFDKAGHSQWIYVEAPGAEARAGKALNMANVQGVEAPPAFVQHVRGVLKPGATLLVTDAPILSGGEGTPLTVIDS
jgi:hypothetical protein